MCGVDISSSCGCSSDYSRYRNSSCGGSYSCGGDNNCGNRSYGCGGDNNCGNRSYGCGGCGGGC